MDKTLTLMSSRGGGRAVPSGVPFDVDAIMVAN